MKSKNRKETRVWLAFYKVKPEDGIADKAIKLWTRGPYSHVEIVVKDKNSPTGFTQRSFRLETGYREIPHTFDKDTWDYRMIKINDYDRYIKFSESLKGAKYDMLGIIFSQIVPLGIEDRKRWFCSEYCTHAILVAGTSDKRLWYVKPERVHPNKLAKLVNINFTKKKTFKKKLNKEVVKA